ncbi:MAG: electron transfer flavoprotein subunit beta/FixA family protein [Anaerolineae bacterium]
MRIVVCIKQILDPDTIRISRSQQAIDDRGAKKIMNPPDRWALDAALRIKETDPSVEVIALSVGDTGVEDILREAMALGCDRAILLSDAYINKARSAGLAQIVAAAIRRLRNVQLVMTGHMALDTGSGTLGPRLAIELGDWPVLMNVDKLQLEGNHVSGLQYADDKYYISSYPLPAVATILETPQYPRYPNGAEIINAYRLRNVEVWSSLSLGIDPAQLPAPTTGRQLRLPPARQLGTVIEGSPAEAAEALVSMLKVQRIL